MKKVSKVLRDIADLVDKGRVSEDEVHAVLNGSLINGTGIYENGMVREGGRVLSLPPIKSIKWPEPKAPEPKVPEPKGFTQTVKVKKDADIKLP